MCLKKLGLMENRFRKYTLWLSLLWFLYMGSGGATGVILCFAADGHAKLELQLDAKCAEAAGGKTVEFSQELLNASIFPPPLGDRCGPCTDIALPITYTLQRPGFPHTESMPQQLLSSVGLLAAPFSGPSKMSDAVCSLDAVRPFASILSHLSTVILLI